MNGCTRKVAALNYGDYILILYILVVLGRWLLCSGGFIVNVLHSVKQYQGLIQDFCLGGGGQHMLECQTCVRYVIVLAILHILIHFTK